ncbi:MAG: putative molybdenum carrier protein [Dehalococcoidia bacterium]|nr:putative molybdenum carrier protein [Dehalococcoidia bacterium]
MSNVIDIGKARARAAEHTCHAIGCEVPVKPERLMCLAHWRRVPRAVQDRVLQFYRPGQCDDWEVSEEYCAAAHAAVLAVADSEGRTITGDEPELRLYRMLSSRAAGIDPEVAPQRALALPREPRVDLLAWRDVLQAPVLERLGDPPPRSGCIDDATPRPDWRFPFPLRRVISGGQTGADQAGLLAARRLGLDTGGWAPKGWRTTRGAMPSLAALGLHECASSDYPVRTDANVRDSDGTVIFLRYESPGEKCTRAAVARHNKPCVIIAIGDLFDPQDRAVWLHTFVEWIYKHEIHILNIAGNSEETDPGIGSIVENFLMLALAPPMLARLELHPIEAPSVPSPPAAAPPAALPDLALPSLPNLVLPSPSPIAAGDDFMLPVIVLTDDQRAAVKRILRWAHGEGPPMLSLTGFAGTGKTSILRELAPDLPQPVVWAGMTGKAATRLHRLARVPARTFHSVFYEPPEEDGGELLFSGVRQPIIGSRSDATGGERVRILTVDEASMTSPTILDDLQREWIPEGVRVLFVGDPFQLPPVLDKEEEARHGRDFSIFEKVKGPALWHVHRAQGGILGAATAIRTTGAAPKASDGSYTYRACRAPLLDAVAAWLADSHDHVLVTWRNELRMIANQKIRGGLGRTDVFPQPGDLICAKKNAQFGRVLNGEVYRVRAIEQGPWMADVMTHWIQTDGPSILASCAGRKVPMDGSMPWMSSLRNFRTACEREGAVEPIPITWGYCLSGHSAQGSEYRRVTVFLAGDYSIPHFNAMTRLPDGSQVRFSSRWLYTATTRAREHVALYTTPGGR